MAHEIGTILIKFSDVEVKNLITALSILEDTYCYGCSDTPDGEQWKRPYVSLKNDLSKMIKKLEEKKREDNIDGKKKESTSYEEQTSPQACD